jgi:hypothetical protein
LKYAAFLFSKKINTMPKPKLSDFKKRIATMKEKELREELITLFSKVKQVPDFYAQDLMSQEDKKKVLEECKSKIYKEFWTSAGNPRTPNNAKIRTIISNFEKMSGVPYDIIDLLFYRVRLATEFANEFGGASDAVYNASSNAFEKAIDLILKHDLFKEFKDSCVALFQFDNLDYWYIEDLKSIYENAFGE